ncbi:MAG: hypothetical protein WCG27_07710 [Pseudomonadota bacterium]
MTKSVKCSLCGDNMETILVGKYNKPHGIALVSAGLLFLVAMPADALLGLVLLPFGLVVSLSKKEVWYCPTCFAISEKITKKEKIAGDCGCWSKMRNQKEKKENPNWDEEIGQKG